MNRCKVSVRLNGSMTQLRPNKVVSVAEIPVLRFIHGTDSVFDIRPTDLPLPIAEDMADMAELDRLILQYGEEAVVTVFPGGAPTLPESLSDLGVDVDTEAASMRLRAAELSAMADDIQNSGKDKAPTEDLTL